MELTFLGAAGTVTGSRHLLEADGQRILIDCGLFQGLKQLRLRNWGAFPVPPDSIEAIVLTHAHLDHSGYLPRLAHDGFQGTVYATPATVDLCQILLADSAHIQESDADFANRHKVSKHTPAMPLYTLKDVDHAMRQLKRLSFDMLHQPQEGISLRFLRAGHILGASIVEVHWKGCNIVFSGDLGRYDDPLMPDPAVVKSADYLVLESTYGDRRHDQEDPETRLGDIIRRTAARGGTVIIPAFAVGRAQLLLWYLYRLKQKGQLPGNLPIYLDSPMSVNTVDVYRGHSDDLRLNEAKYAAAFNVAHYVRDVEESKALDNSPMPKVIISASGMATGGRVLHHLKRYAPDVRSSILFSGFQAAGTRGAKMLHGAETVKIHGEYIPVRAELHNLSMLSAHADTDEIMRWLSNFEKPPKETFLVHGEPEAADTLRLRIKDELGWSCRVAQDLEKVSLR
ncbi:MBL fold metallo-hydrolase RNA specificity domain-containing protein [Eoetvoesiella caeni]|uniref:Metallo-beta-lactamase family protein n=1 Tax=Eoetvoesiella caeni TaxID=645616 RepID=A0A366HKE8_9BURK|nr:MBL fold metallo-hydrolase [Eoetvoesiella caeni]MCI2807686.1 MBL fold metallo-hydrolase [Eoetvoesiella caeni]NYT52919.1 MBL fold metallo-hydrolase [Eoetvoesiella caeni]RBP42896.1 metallo-beta-lactamase family protein [Eoetvoesiella caeni]